MPQTTDGAMDATIGAVTANAAVANAVTANGTEAKAAAQAAPVIPRRRRPEVLAPAGNLTALKTAVDFGADAVYCSGKMFGMRSAPRNLTLEELEEGARYAHARGARVYVTCNILPTNPEVEGMTEYIGRLGEIGVDAIIVTDIGVMMAARKVAPNLEIHISTQAGVTNYLAANTLYELGARRVVLARELSLRDVAQIRRNTPDDLDIETFVHGSMCMAFSGRCLISNFMTGRSGNHGECAQPCRWRYSVVEEKRPGQYFPVEQTKDGAYIFNSQDMNMLDHVGDVIEAGASSLKIEGRAKSAYYVAAMTNAYKTAVSEYLAWREEHGPVTGEWNGADDAVTGGSGVPAVGRPGGRSGDANDAPAVVPEVSRTADGEEFRLPHWLHDEPFKVSHRDYCTGFWYRQVPAAQNVDRGGYYRDWIVVGDVRGWSDGRVSFVGRNKIVPGQHIEILQPGREPLELEVADDIRDDQGVPVAEANHPTRVFSLPCPEPIVPGAAMRTRALKRTLKAE